MQNMSVARRRRDRTDSAEYSDASYEEDNHINSGDEDEGDSEYDSAEHSVSDDLSERESGDGQAAPGSQKGDRVDHDEDRRNPQYIPKRGTFYEHDDRTAPGEEEGEATEEKDGSVKGTSVTGDVIMTSGPGRERTGGVTATPTAGTERKPRQSRASAADRWTHDKFNENDQAPKSSEELVSIYGYDIRGEEGPPRAFRRRKYGRGPNKYTRNWEDEQAYGAKTTPARAKAPPQVTNGEEFPSLQSTSERTKGDRRRNGTTHDIPKKTIEVVTVKKQETDKNANNTKATSHSTPSDHHHHHHSGGSAGPKHTPAEKVVTVPKQRTAGTGRVGLVPPGPLRRPYTENKDAQHHQSTHKETHTPIPKISVPPSAGLPSASLGGTQEKKSSSVRKPNSAGMPPRMQQTQQSSTQQQSIHPTIVQAAQQPQQQLSTVANTVNNNATINSTTSTRTSPPQQQQIVSNVQSQVTAQQASVVTEVSSGRGKRYSSIRQRPMPDQYQPVQYMTDYQPSPQQAQQSAPTQQQPSPVTMPNLPHRQTPPPSLQSSQQQQLLSQQNQQLLQTQQMTQQIHQKTPPPQIHQHQATAAMQQMIQPTQGIHQTNPNLIQTTQHTLHQTSPNIHQPSQPLHQINPSMQQMHQPSPTLHQTNPPVHQSNVTMLQSTPQQMLQTNPPIHQASPSIHQASPSIHQSTPPMLQSTASLHPTTPSMIQGQQIHQQSTTLHQSSGSLHQTNSSLHQASPTLHQASPTLHQASPTLHQASPTLHQASPTLHQANPPLHQSSQPILQNNPPLHQVSPPLQPQIGRQGSGPAVSTIPMRQVQRTHQQMPIHNMPAPTHLQGSIPQQGLVATQTYPAQPMIPQTQYIQNNGSGIYSHNIPPQVYQPQPGYAAPPPALPYHHQPTPPYVNQTGRSVYREPSGITFYSPQEQKGTAAPPPTRRPTNAIPIVPPPSRRDRERLSDAAAAQKDNIDHIVDNMFVPRHQQPRNAAPRPGDVAKTIEPVTSQMEPGSEEKTKDGSGDKSSKEASVEPVTPAPVTDIAVSAESQPLVVEDKEVRLTVESLASEVSEKLALETNSQLQEQLQVDQEDISAEYVDCEQQIFQEVDDSVQPTQQQPCVAIETQQQTVEETPSTGADIATSVTDVTDQQLEYEEPTAEALIEEEPVQSNNDVEKVTNEVEKEMSGIQDIPIIDEQSSVVVESEPTIEEEKVDTSKVDVPDVAVTIAETSSEVVEESEIKMSTEEAAE